MAETKQQEFVTILERTVNLNGKEFRISVTHNKTKDTFTVGVREYTRTDKYTGYSKFNGVTLPAPDQQTAQILAHTIAQGMEQSGFQWG